MNCMVFVRSNSGDNTEPYTNNKENENIRNPLNGQKLISSMHGKLGGTDGKQQQSVLKRDRLMNVMN